MSKGGNSSGICDLGVLSRGDNLGIFSTLSPRGSVHGASFSEVRGHDMLNILSHLH